MNYKTEKIKNFVKIPFFLKAFLIAILLVSFKWILSYMHFDEDIILRIINDSSDTAYYPLIKTFSDFDLAPSYSISPSSLNIISFPILSLFINSFFFKIIGSYSFILLEIICTTFFILIFYNIFLKLNFSNHFSIICSILLFILPTFLLDLTFINLSSFDLLTVNLQKFYSMRFPRPIVSNLYFFSFIYFSLDFFLKKENYIKNFYILAILMGLSINSFFYLFFIEFFLLTIIFFIKFKKNLINIFIKNLKHFFYSSVIFILFILLFQIQLFYSEIEYIERLGVFDLNFDQRIILFNYLGTFFLGKNFILLFFVNTLLFFILKNKPIKIFYFLFLSSILSPIFFFLIYNRIVDYYHFFVLIVITGTLFPTIYILHFVESKIFKLVSNKNLKSLMNIFLFFIILYFNFSIGLKFKDNFEKPNIERNSLIEITNFINKDVSFKDKNLEILNLNIKLSTWLILSEYKNFSIIPVSIWTPKKNKNLEIELISTLKFLQLNKIDFFNLIKNKQRSWRYKNDFVYNFIGRKYLANSLINFNNNIDDFEEIEKEYINKNSIISSHQLIIPKLEIERLLNKFDEINTQINPDIIIIDNSSFFKSTKFENNDFCLTFINQIFKVYINKKLKSECL